MVEIYGMESCVLCKKAIELCEQFQLRYIYKDVASSPEMGFEFIEKFPDSDKVPQILWNGIHFKTYNAFQEEVYNTRNYGDAPL